MYKTFYNSDERHSVLGALRSQFPDRQVRMNDALRIAEWQATRLLDLFVVESPSVPSEVITELPRINVEYRDIPTSGMTYWDGSTWIIAINRSEPYTRQRFTLFHEFKHIIDHGRKTQLYTTDEQAEQAADYFAGCALMPRKLLKHAWGDGLQRPTLLARLFEVSPRAVSVRLAQTGLTDDTLRCAPRGRTVPTRKPDRYFRSTEPTHALGFAS